MSIRSIDYIIQIGTSPEGVIDAPRGTIVADQVSGIPYCKATPRGLRTGWRPMVVVEDVRNFGAVGDGLTDDTLAFRSAIEAAPAGGIIHVPAGRFVLDSLTVSRDVGFSGGTGAILLHKANAVGHMIQYTAPCSRGLKDLVLDGNKSNQSGRFDLVRFFSDNAVIERCTFRNFSAAALRDFNCPNSLLVKECLFLDGAEHGGLLGQATVGIEFNTFLQENVRPCFTVKNCQFRQSADASTPGKNPGGIFVKGNDSNNAYVQVTVDGCEFERIGQNWASNRIVGIEIYEDCEQVLLRGNRFLNCYLGCVDIQNSGKVLVEGNFVLNLRAGGENGGVIAAAFEYDPGSGDVSGTKEICLIRHNLVDGIPPGTGKAIWVHGETAAAREIQLVGNHLKNVPNGIVIDGISAATKGYLLSGNTIYTAAAANGKGLAFENFAGVAIIINNRIVAGPNSHGLIATVAMANATLQLDNNYFEAESSGNRAFLIEGAGKVISTGGLYLHTGGGVAVRIRKDSSNNLIQQLYWTRGNVVLQGTENIVAADVLTWLGQDLTLKNIAIASGSPTLAVKSSTGTTLCSWDESSGNFAFGPNAVSSTWKAQSRNDLAGLGSNFRVLNNSAAGAGTLGLDANDASGFLAAYSSTFATARRAGKVGLVLNSSALAGIFAAEATGQTFDWYIEGTGLDIQFTASAIALQSGFAFNWSSSIAANGPPDVGLIRDAPGRLRATNGTTGIGKLCAASNVLTQTIGTTLSETASGSVVINSGATSLVTLALPIAPTLGTLFHFAVADTDGIRISCGNAAHQIRIAATTTTPTTGYVEAMTVGHTLSLIYLGNNFWWAIASQGTWTIV